MLHHLPRTLALALVALLVVTAPALGAPIVGTGVRALGMGGAFTAVADDASAPSWNPAGITQVKLSINGAIESSLSDLIPFVSALTQTPFDPFTFAMLQDPNEIVPWISTQLQNLGQPFYAELGLQPTTIGGRLWGGVVGKWAALTARTDIDSDISLVAVGSDYLPVGTTSFQETVMLTGAFRIPAPAAGADWLALGVNVKGFYAVQGTTTHDPTGFYRLDLAQSQGLAGDVGALLKVGESFRVGAVVQDLVWLETGTRWLHEDPDGDPTGVDPTEQPLTLVGRAPVLNVGMAYSPQGSGMTLAFDVQQIRLSSVGVSHRSTLNLGLEQVYGPVAIRFGASAPLTVLIDGITLFGGAGLRLGVFHIDLGFAVEPSARVTGAVEFAVSF